MKKIALSSLALLILLVAAPALAAPARQAEPPTIESILSALLALATLYAAQGGIAALVTALVALGKKIGVVKDGAAGWWAFGLNVAGFAAFVAFQVFGWNFSALDSLLGTVAALLIALLGLIGQVLGSGVIYRSAKASSVPILSYSRKT